jgi:hypothetical protein
MTGLKNIFASKAILTAIVGAIFALLKAFGVTDFDPAVQNTVVAVLFTLAGFFRFTATEKLSIGKPGPGY